MFASRPQQQEILNYRGGWMGVSAIPGSGKTLVLARLGAELLAAGLLRPGQQILVVTLLNSAVENLSARIASILRERGLQADQGYQVRTLHGLAYEILRERPSLARLAEDFEIIEEREADQIRKEILLDWSSKNPGWIEAYLNPDLLPERARHVLVEQVPDLINQVAARLIRSAKDMQISPERLREHLSIQPVDNPLAKMGLAIFDRYQHNLRARGAIDFDDLVHLALQAIGDDPEYLARLRQRWPFILEDEAQDSSHQQELLLRSLSGPGGNWVRVGDPNQSIFETFTTSSPRFLRSFLEEPGVQARFVESTGRFAPDLRRLANRLIEWASEEHPNLELRAALVPPFIQPLATDNGKDDPAESRRAVALVDRSFKPEEEIRFVSDSLSSWLPSHPDRTVAVLVPRNQTGFALVKWLRRIGLPFVEALLSSNTTRKAAASIGVVIACLVEPTSAPRLARAYRIWHSNSPGETHPGVDSQRVYDLLRRCRRVEEYLWPVPGQDWLSGQAATAAGLAEISELERFRGQVRSWQAMAYLPIEQLVLLLAQDLFRDPVLLATAYKLAGMLGQTRHNHPEWGHRELNQELAALARNERRFSGFSDEETGLDSQNYPGKVFVTTIHRAIGLEWDRVYLLSVNNYEFPSGDAGERYIFEPWFVRGRLNLPAEAVAQMSALVSDDYLSYREGSATRQARQEYAAERLRLLYVGLTRARQELIVTWNAGRSGDFQPALPFDVLHAFAKENLFRDSR